MAPTTTKNGTGNGMATWMLRTSVGLLITILLAWAGFLHAQIGDLRVEDKGLHRRVSDTKDAIMEKVSNLEPSLAALQADVVTVKARLESIDHKLDRALLGRRPR